MSSNKPLARTKSGLVMSHATEADLDSLSTLFTRSFLPGSPFYQTLLPNTPANREWWYTAHTNAIKDASGTIFLVCKDGEKVVSVARWVRAAEKDGAATSDGYGSPDGESDRWPEFSEDFNLEYADAFFGSMAEHRERLMGPRRHYYMELLCTDVDYKGQGCASLMLQYGLDETDREGVEAYVDSSPQARKLYEKFGWVTKAEVEMPRTGDFRYVERYMVRPAKGKA